MVREYGAAALGRERDALLAYCAGLPDEAWATPSAAPGWSVQDVVAHMGSAARALFTPAALRLMTSGDIERTNDGFVDDRRSWRPGRVLAEYRAWSGRAVRLAGVVTRTPLARVPMPLAELGRFPTGVVLAGALTFDTHTHLRHDIAPALDRPVPSTDAARLATVLEWMLAVLGNQLARQPPTWLPAPVDLELRGPGGGRWTVHPDGRVTVGRDRRAGIVVRAGAEGFPSWATRRTPWRENDVEVSGDAEAGARFLDDVRIV